MTAQEIYKGLDNIHDAIIDSQLCNSLFHSDIEALVEAKEQYKAKYTTEKQNKSIYQQVKERQDARYAFQDRK